MHTMATIGKLTIVPTWKNSKETFDNIYKNNTVLADWVVPAFQVFYTSFQKNLPNKI